MVYACSHRDIHSVCQCISGELTLAITKRHTPIHSCSHLLAYFACCSVSLGVCVGWVTNIVTGICGATF